MVQPRYDTCQDAPMTVTIRLSEPPMGSGYAWVQCPVCRAMWLVTPEGAAVHRVAAPNFDERDMEW